MLCEIEWAIKKLKNNATGNDGISAELLKHIGHKGVQILHGICQKVWRAGQWPADWTESIIIPLHKKGSTKKCENYRTISLMSHASKILLAIINKRMESYIDRQIPREQAGFVAGRGTREQILNVRQLIEKSREFNSPILMCFIDYAKAFDCVNWHSMFRIMREMGVPAHLTALVQNLYLDGTARVKMENSLSGSFKNERGVRQGCILSPKLFNLYGEYIIRKSLDGWSGGVKVGGQTISNLRYADDTTLLARSEAELAEAFHRMEIESEVLGLKINKNKTKLMIIDRAGSLQRSDELRELEQVHSFVYLGSLVSDTGSCKQEICRRIQIAKQAMTRLDKIWRDRGISRPTKVRLVKTLVFSIFLYGAETWTVKSYECNRIDAFEMWCWRKLLRIPWTAHRTNASIRSELRITTRLSGVCLKRVLGFFGHIVRREPDNLERAILLGGVEGRRGRGRIPTRWTDQVKDALGETVYNAATRAMDREGWRNFVNQWGHDDHDPQ